MSKQIHVTRCNEGSGYMENNSDKEKIWHYRGSRCIKAGYSETVVVRFW